MLSRVTALDVIQRLFLVNINEHLAVDSFENARAFDLTRLKYHIAVRENDRRPPCAEALEDVEGAGIETVGERIVHQERRHRQQVRFSRVFDTKTLQCAQIIAVAQIGEELFENRPVSVSRSCPEFTLEMALEVILDAVVVQQRIVDIDEKNDWVGWHN